LFSLFLLPTLLFSVRRAGREIREQVNSDFEMRKKLKKHSSLESLARCAAKQGAALPVVQPATKLVF